MRQRNRYNRIRIKGQIPAVGICLAGLAVMVLIPGFMAAQEPLFEDFVRVDMANPQGYAIDPTAATAGDFNCDGALDLVAWTWDWVAMAVLWNDGSGAFPDQNIISYGGFCQPGVGRFDPGSCDDLAVTFWMITPVPESGTPTPGPEYGYLTVMVGDASDPLKVANDRVVDGHPGVTVLTDFNRDGWGDTAVLNASGFLSVFLNDGAGNLAEEIRIPSLSGTMMTSADVQRNGYPDILVTSAGQVRVLHNLDGQSFVPEDDVVFSDPVAAITAADLNRDGSVDLAAAVSGTTPDTYRISVRLNDGFGDFTQSTDYSVNYRLKGITTGDFNSDGYPDIAVSSDNGKIYVWLNDGAGGVMHDGRSYPFPLSGYNSKLLICAGDLDGDGAVDITAPGGSEDCVAVLINRSDTPAPPTATPPPPYTPTPTATPTDTGVTATPTSSPETGVLIEMSQTFFVPGDTCWCRATVRVSGSGGLDGYPLFVVLQVGDALFWAPGFQSEVASYLSIWPRFEPGDTVVEVLPEFTWPQGAGVFADACWYAAVTDPDVTGIVGDLGQFAFGWGDP